MTILLLFHFGTYCNFKHYYIYCICEYMKCDFPNAASYNKFVELEQRIFFKLVFFLKLFTFGRCTGESSSQRVIWQSLCRQSYISPKLFDSLFDDGIQLVHGIKTNMKNRLMSFYYKMMLRKRYIIETINDLLKNKSQLVHSRHRLITNFLVPCGCAGSLLFL